MALALIFYMEFRMPENNRWYHYNQTTDTTVVFVHGFFSDSSLCWNNKKKNAMWPDLVKKDSRIQDVSIFMGGYYTHVDSGTYAVRECSQELFDSLRMVDQYDRKAPLSFHKIVFVCHSLGGIVVRYMLECFREHFRSHKIGLVLMASPSVGSDYADRFTKIAEYYNNRTARQLRMNSELLADLDERFKDFIDSREHNSFFGVEATEHIGFLHLRWLPGFQPIVLKNSSSRYFAKSRTIAGTNHSTIVKPSDPDHGSHRFLVDFLNNTFFPKVGIPTVLPIHEKSLVTPSIGNQYTSQGPLFDIYDESCEQFYLPRKIDEQVRLDFQHNSFWIHGPSGSGKTSIIKRLLSKAGFRSVDMCFSQCLNGDYRSMFISEMVETLYVSDFRANPIPARTINNLIRQITDGINSGSYLFIYIDEVPQTDENSSAEQELIRLIEDLLTSIKQVAKANSFRFVISSLGKPDFLNSQNPSKLSGYLRIIECEKWTDEELSALITLITESLEPDRVDPLPYNLIKEAKGSPRFIKSFLKTKLAYPDRDNGELIRMTAQGFQF
ncbi:hypothetical protein ALP94_05647 [Pseudomonas savastanoi pv. glycinea]|nr:hypothetical protein ALP94_05647 [Pseudomonas savastanoi pv. glycinea]